ncbi:hypothetical protein C8T65DRAFT_262101 [Cerioporus squamosus]|nr:hypothetical protein C8T65DRAFT_262101 [Cerioporus squamosus]
MRYVSLCSLSLCAFSDELRLFETGRWGTSDVRVNIGGALYGGHGTKAVGCRDEPEWLRRVQQVIRAEFGPEGGARQRKSVVQKTTAVMDQPAGVVPTRRRGEERVASSALMAAMVRRRTCDDAGASWTYRVCGCEGGGRCVRVADAREVRWC